ncbi:MAG: phosphate ABC transporter substrate-binding protein [delta proteobacterium MLS_D]|jgi:phosphate transport system substrate-binding protein|nr:MAG: phosphate ABC transporter substrate-binding protein [delta proteobacterium MLS_D]
MTKIFTGFLAVLSALILVSSPAFSSESVTMTGSTTVLPIAQATLEAYMKANPGVHFSLSGTGSGDGIKALIDKTTDIANASRAMKAGEMEKARHAGIYPIEFTVGIDAIVPIVHPSNPVSDLSIDQLSQIYQGRITNWKDVGGEDRPIVVVSRDSSSGTYECWSDLVLKKQRVSPKAQLQASSGAVVETASTNRNALAYVGMGYLNSSVKAVHVNGIAPSMETAKSGEYPISRPLFMYTDSVPTGETARYLRFVLSPEGQKIVEETGYVPLR